MAEFIRSKIRLTESSVSTILLACFGGHASLFKVQQLQNWSFKFVISSKEVGLSIIKGSNISVPDFNINFLLWGEGGPKSSYELDLYLQEKEDEWTHVFRRHPRKSYVQALTTPATYQAPAMQNQRSNTIPSQSLNSGVHQRCDQLLAHSTAAMTRREFLLFKLPLTTSRPADSLPCPTKQKNLSVLGASYRAISGLHAPTVSNVGPARDGATSLKIVFSLLGPTIPPLQSKPTHHLPQPPYL